MHPLCIACVHWPACTHQNCMEQCMQSSVFEVLHLLNVQAQVRMCLNVLKFSYSICSSMLLNNTIIWDYLKSFIFVKIRGMLQGNVVV